MHAFAPPHARTFAPGSRTHPATCARRSTLRATAVSSARATLTPESDAKSSSTDVRAAAPVDQVIRPSDQARIAAVRQQMEFWFSASNLRRDWYLRRQMDQDGWLDPSIFLMFNRIKNLNASLHDIIDACRSSEELEVSAPNEASFGDDAGQTRVRRSPELPDFREDDDHELARSFILKGIPAESSVDSLLALFEPIATVNYVRIYRNKQFPDTPRALICFESPETANAVFELFRSEPPAGAEGIVLRRRQSPNTDGQKDFRGRSTSTESKPSLIVCHITGLMPDIDWKTLHQQLQDVFINGSSQPLRYLMYSPGKSECYITTTDSEKVRELITTLTETGLEINGEQAALAWLTENEDLRQYWKMASEHQAARLARRAEREATFAGSGSGSGKRYPQGVIVKVTGLPADASWRQIKADLGRFGNVVYLNREDRDTFCFARFMTADEAVSVRDALSQPEELLCDASVDVSILEGEDETQYWIRAEENVKERRNRSEKAEGNNE